MPRVIYLRSLILFAALLVSCVSTKTHHWKQTDLREGLLNLRNGCKLTSNSGFSAEVSIPLHGTTRIDAAWDALNILNGQIVNTLGEDLVNFKIDSSGILQADVDVRKDLALGSALDFLAELGTAKARLLLCSGLFLAGNEDFAQGFGQEKQSVRFDIRTHSFQWQVRSFLHPVFPESGRPQDALNITSEVRTQGIILSHAVARIEWSGAKKSGVFRPQELRIDTGAQSVKLSFLDFE